MEGVKGKIEAQEVVLYVIIVEKGFQVVDFVWILVLPGLGLHLDLPLSRRSLRLRRLSGPP